MKVIVDAEDAYILVPHGAHQNVSQTNTTIPKGSVLEGEPFFVKGRKRGQPYEFRLFKTKDNTLIYYNKVKPMEKTEVTLGADAQVAPTVVNVANAEYYSQLKLILGGAGAVAGFLYAKHKGKTKWKWAVGGLVLGYVVAYVIDKKRGVTIKH